jgi:hypothetical protein
MEADTIYERLNSIYGQLFKFESIDAKVIKAKLLHSLADYIVRRNLGKQYLSILESQQQTTSTQNLRFRDAYELNRIGLVVPRSHGFGWEPIKKLSFRQLEIVLEEYARETNISIEDVLREIRGLYKTKPTQTDEMIEADIKKEARRIGKKTV